MIDRTDVSIVQDIQFALCSKNVLMVLGEAYSLLPFSALLL